MNDLIASVMLSPWGVPLLLATFFGIALAVGKFAKLRPAQAEVQKQPPSCGQAVAIGCMGVCLLFVGCVAWVATRPGGSSEVSAVTGYVGPLKSDALVCPTRADFDRATQLSIANDVEGVRQMALQGRVMLVRAGTQVRVIQTEFTCREIRVMDGPFTGKSGWVVTEALQ